MINDGQAGIPFYNRFFFVGNAIEVISEHDENDSYTPLDDTFEVDFKALDLVRKAPLPGKKEYPSLCKDQCYIYSIGGCNPNSLATCE